MLRYISSLFILVAAPNRRTLHVDTFETTAEEGAEHLMYDRGNKMCQMHIILEDLVAELVSVIDTLSPDRVEHRDVQRLTHLK